MGDEVDILGVDEKGRLLCIEAKPASVIELIDPLLAGSLEALPA